MSSERGIFLDGIYGYIKNAKIEDLCKLLAVAINQAVVVADESNRIVAYAADGVDSIDINTFFTINQPRDKATLSFPGDYLNKLYAGYYSNEDKLINYIYIPLLIDEDYFGNSIILCELDELSEEAMTKFREMSLIFLLALREKRMREEAQHRFHDEIVYDILYNNYDSKIALFEKAKQLGWDIEGSYVVIAVDIADGNYSLARKIGPVIFNHHPVNYTVINDKLIAILTLNNLFGKNIEESINIYIHQFMDNLKSNNITDSYFGISSRTKALTDIHHSFQEAKISLELSRVFDLNRISFFDKMGFLKFIFAAPAHELQEFQIRILGKLIDHDLEYESELIPTIKSLIDNRMQISTTAKDLFIHENTLRNRIKKIEEISNIEIGRIDHMINLYIALQITNLYLKEQ